jgi:plasmid stabilization system protein ParE
MKLEWSDDALADLDRFVEFLSKQRPSLASAVASQIIAKVEVPRSRFSVSTRGLVGPSAGGFDGERLVMLRVFHACEARE